MRMRHHSEFMVYKPLQVLLLIITTLAALVLAYDLYQRPSASDVNVFLLLFSISTAVFVALERKNYSVFFLLSTFTLVTAWRLSALAGYDNVTYIYLGALFIILFQFAKTAWNDVHAPYANRHLNPFSWQVTFIRLYIGCDLVPHFCEKLFAGSAVRAADLAYFASVNTPNPFFFVILAGLIEFFGGLALSCGFLTRTASVGLCAYFLIASVIGNHFNNGFIWASPAGGWEYPTLCAALFLSFFLKGAGLFSWDGTLQQMCKLPRWVVGFMGKV